MIEVKTKLQKWGNSYGIVIPINFVRSKELKEGEEVEVILIKKRKTNVLRETFGKGKFSKSVAEMMKETDKDLYDI